MPDVHAKFSPSASDRLIHCPPSLMLGEQYGPEDTSSDYTREGTEAHALGEYLLKTALGQTAKDPRPSMRYWFKHDLDRITERLRSLGILYARIDTEDSIRRWNRKMIPVGLIHPASAGHGLNLQAGGSTLVWFGLTWSLELYQQTNARLWRQGQVSDTVVIQHIVTKGTVDERIIKALENKEASGCLQNTGFLNMNCNTVNLLSL